MIYTTLNNIVNDLLLIVRGSNIAASEPISKRQIEEWIHKYRALLIKQDLDKGRYINPDYVQLLPSVEIVPEDTAGSRNTIETGNKIYRTSQQIPKTIDLHFKSGIVDVSTLTDESIQLVPSTRRNWQQYKRWTGTDTMAYLKDQYIYLTNPKGIMYIKVRGIFENPLEAMLFTNDNVTDQDVTLDSPYPVPANMIPVIKEMILQKELRIETIAPTDTKNDSASIIPS